MKKFCLTGSLNKRIKRNWSQNMRLVFLILIGSILTVSANSSSQTTQLNLKSSTISDLIALENTVHWVQPAQQQQQRTITGVVMDRSEQALPGVSIVVKGTTTGTITNTDGEFSLTIPADAEVLVFSFIGLLTQEIDIGDRTTFTVIMEEDVIGIEEVVAVGYGTMSREVLTTSVSTLDNKVLENIPYTNVAAALQGSVAGLRIQQTSGQPGAGPRIIMRGGTSINNPNSGPPLVIVDGVIRPNMNHLNPDDIESIDVLKDAASTAIYGARASNGVILIQTKSAKMDQAEFNYKYSLTSSTNTRFYDLASPRDYVTFMRQGVYDRREHTPALLPMLSLPTAMGDGNDLTNNTPFTVMELSSENEHLLDQPPDEWGAVWETAPDPVDPSRTLIFKGMDFQDVMFRTGYTHNHTISGYGGTDRSKFNVSLGYQDADGAAIETEYKRFTLNSNGEIRASDNLTVFGGVNYSHRTQQTIPSTGAFFKNNAITAPTTKYRFEDGTLAPGRLFTNGNPAYYISRYDRDYEYSSLIMRLGSRWEITPGLTFDPQISVMKNDSYGRSFLKSYLNGPGNLITTRNSSGSYSTTLQTQADLLLNYNTIFRDNHNLSVLLGSTYFNTYDRSLSAGGTNAASDLIPTLNAAGEPSSAGGGESEHTMLGAIGRINYNYQQKYLISLSSRYDGASNLGDQYKWGYFPGASLGWNIHRENFWSTRVLSSMKLRISYGVTGNISGLGRYAAQGAYAVGGAYAGQSEIYNSAMANQDLRWERSTTLDVGTDLGLFNERASITLDVFRRVTDNLLTNMSLPASTGFSSILTNLGSLENKGIEVEIGGRIMPTGSDFQWIVDLNASTWDSKILQLPPNDLENNRIGGVYVWDPSINDHAYLGGRQEGQRIGDLYIYVQEGIYATDEEAQAGPVDMIVVGPDKTKHGGDTKWADLDGNGIIDERDRAYMGNVYPSWNAGLSNSFSYKNFNVIVRMDALGGHVYDYETSRRLLGQFSGQQALGADIVNSWQQQGDITDIPKFYWADQHWKKNIHRGTSESIRDGDFLCLREVTLAYTVPQRLLDRFGMNSLRLNLTGNNLGYLAASEAPNVEGASGGGLYPIPRNLILGININF